VRRSAFPVSIAQRKERLSRRGGRRLGPVGCGLQRNRKRGVPHPKCYASSKLSVCSVMRYTKSGQGLAVKRAGRRLRIALRPHELRRYAVTFASTSGVLLEVVSKVILRHKNLSTTQRYLGRVTEAEAMKWIDRIYD
jgi:integrase